MILRKIFNPYRVFQYMRTELIVSLTLSLGVYVLYAVSGSLKQGLPFSIAAILGSAVAIFIAFRNNSAYNRWWEARTLWGGIVNSSRIFARQIIANANFSAETGKTSQETADAYKREMLLRQIAFAHALRLQLRRQDNPEAYRHLLENQDFAKVSVSQNPPNYLLFIQGLRIREGMKMEVLGAFDNISMEPVLASFNNYQGSCERIKNTPLLRQYHFFTLLFLYAFMLVLPFSLIADFMKSGIAALMVPVSVLLSFVFAVMAKVGEVNEDPFENRITDVSMSAICNTIERDLKEMLGEAELPAKVQPVSGHLM